ncbi:MAG: polysaccharide biosynthesis C-terminal domain-containing protein [Synergistaceae bacterium]|jgi:putative peptidoglycan lipid II flippase|nr:polysaccharide biosynthesis C-terminal domain-containing protein [Synergistaceae bacterium]
MMRILPFGFIRKITSRLLDVKSARGVSFALMFFMMLSKPLGYVRTLIIAWAFGTSPGMDAFHAANGVITLFAGGIGGAMESAILPEMGRTRKESGELAYRSLFAAVVLFILFLVALSCATFLLVPGELIRLFASGFDDERVRIGARMIWWLVPFAIVFMLRPLLEVLALLNEKYTLSSICSLAFNFVAIPALLFLAPIIGTYSVAACMSIGQLVTFILFLTALKGVPLIVKISAIPQGCIARIWANTLYSLLLTSSSTVFVIVDRYFASRLPMGSVSAISYGATILGIFHMALVSPLAFFLSRVSKLALENRNEARNVARQTVAIVFAYSLPIGFFTAVTAKPIVSLVFGWGRFDAHSVEMTATCLLGYNVGLVFAIASSVIYRYAQGLQRLERMIPLIYAMVVVNAALDWLMVGRWGLLGLALATSVTQSLTFIIYYLAVMNDSLWRFFIESRFFHQLAGVLVCAALIMVSGRFGMRVQFVYAAAMMLIYLFGAEKAGIMSSVPPHWRPRALVAFLASNSTRARKKRGESQ